MPAIKHSGPHYGWMIVLTGIAVLFAILGLGRFALGMLLPSMSSDLQLNYEQMGLLSTFNFVGYLLAVLSAGRLTARFGYRVMITAGVLLAMTGMALISASQGFITAVIALTLLGLGSGAANMPIMGLIAHWFLSSRRGLASGLLLMGNSLGIVLSGVVVPLINTLQGSAGWRSCWQLFALLSLLIAIAAAAILRNSPADKGLHAIGRHPQAKPEEHEQVFDARRFLGQIGSVYFLFGFTYVIYATFIVTALIDDYRFSEATAGQLWIWIGLLSLFSGPLFGMLSDRIGRGRTLMIVFIMQGCAYLPVAFSLEPLLYLSIFLFGISVWSIPPIVAAAVADALGQEKAVSAIGQVTLFFGVGQISGPAIAGYLAESSNSFASSFLLCVVLTLIGALGSHLLQRRLTGKR